MEYGLDFSNHQRTVDVSQVAASGKRFGFVKATEGLSYDDPYFVANWRGLKQAGLVRGAYHFLDGISLGKQEAYFFLSRVVWSPGDIPIFDVEQSPSLIGEELAACLDVLTRELGTPGMIYTGKWFADNADFGHFPELAKAGLWIANWNNQPGTLSLDDIPEPWNSMAGGLWAVHQYTATGTCPGVSGSCLLDVFNGSIDRLPLYGVH